MLFCYMQFVTRKVLSKETRYCKKVLLLCYCQPCLHAAVLIGFQR